MTCQTGVILIGAVLQWLRKERMASHYRQKPLLRSWSTVTTKMALSVALTAHD